MAIFGTSWVSDAEKRIISPCDLLRDDFDPRDSMLRGISVKATPQTVYKWLNQLQYGPYSYDWLDNPGRKSPQYLIEDNPSLKPGKPALGMFNIVSCEPDAHFTSVMKPNFFPGLKECAVTYIIVQHRDHCRLLVKINVIYKKSVVGYIMRALLSLGDAIMMGKQLKNMKRLAERTEATYAA